MGRTGEVAFFRYCEDLPLSLGDHSTRRTGRLARVHDVEDPPLDLNKGRLASDHGAGGGPLPRARKKSSKLELKGEVGRSRVARFVRTSNV